MAVVRNGTEATSVQLPDPADTGNWVFRESSAGQGNRHWEVRGAEDTEEGGNTAAQASGSHPLGIQYSAEYIAPLPREPACLHPG